jgi:predicted dehydrogenase
MTVMGCQAGKDVYSEKPLSLTIREAVRMAEEAKKYSRIVQGGTQARSSPTISFAMEQIRKGAIGDVKTVQVGCWGQARFMDITAEPIPDYLDWDMFVGPAKMCPYSKIRWSGRREFSGGVITDWGHHFFDVAQWGLGMDESGPVEVFPAGGDHEFVTLRYSNGAEIQLHAKNGKALSTGTTFIGSQGKIYTQAWEDYVEFEPKELGLAYLKAHKLKVPEGLPTDQKTLAVQIDGSVPPKERDDFSDNGTGLHVANFIDCVKTRKPSNADVQLSRRSVTLAHLVNISLWENRPLKWDPEKFEFPGDDKANSYIHIEPRAPWKL